MKDDIFESISQGGSGEETAENRRIHEISDELRRRSQLYEAQFRDGQVDVTTSCRAIFQRKIEANNLLDKQTI